MAGTVNVKAIENKNGQIQYEMDMKGFVTEKWGEAFREEMMLGLEFGKMNNLNSIAYNGLTDEEKQNKKSEFDRKIAERVKNYMNKFTLNKLDKMAGSSKETAKTLMGEDYKDYITFRAYMKYMGKDARGVTMLLRSELEGSMDVYEAGKALLEKLNNADKMNKRQTAIYDHIMRSPAYKNPTPEQFEKGDRFFTTANAEKDMRDIGVSLGNRMAKLSATKGDSNEFKKMREMMEYYKDAVSASDAEHGRIFNGDEADRALKQLKEAAEKYLKRVEDVKVKTGKGVSNRAERVQLALAIRALPDSVFDAKGVKNVKENIAAVMKDKKAVVKAFKQEIKEKHKKDKQNIL